MIYPQVNRHADKFRLRATNLVCLNVRDPKHAEIVQDLATRYYARMSLHREREAY